MYTYKYKLITFMFCSVLLKKVPPPYTLLINLLDYYMCILWPPLATVIYYLDITSDSLSANYSHKFTLILLFYLFCNWSLIEKKMIMNRSAPLIIT